MMNVKALKSLLAAAIIALAMPAIAQEQNPMTQQLPIDTQVRYGVLDNGLTYYIRHNETPKNRAEFHIAQSVGSILEEESQRGLAHFLEHMAFNGLEHFPGKTMLNYLEHNGIKFGTDINAYTGFDETVYRISNVPTTNPGLVDSCLLVLHDWSCAILLEDDEIDSERGVIHEEWRTRNDANWRIIEKILPEMFAGSQYANRLPIGTMEVVMNFPYQDLRDYYHKWYRPDNQGIIVIGDIDVDQMEARIKELFSPIKMPENPAERIYYTVPDNVEPIYVVGSDKEATSTSVDINFKHDPMPKELRGTMMGVVNDYVESVASIMLNNRFREITNKPNAPFMGAYAYDGHLYGIAVTKDAFSLSATVEEGKVLDGLKGVLREAERVNRFGFTATEYDRAKADLLAQYENLYNERNNRRNIQYANEYIRHFIDGGYIPGIELEYQLMQGVAPQIPLEAVNQYIEEIINDSNIIICVTGPEKEGITYPTKEEALAAINEVKAEEITAYVDEVSNEPLIANEPVAGRVIAEIEGSLPGTTEWILSNGVRVVLKPTDFKDDEILMTAVSEGGKTLYGNEDAANLKALPMLYEVGGLGNFSSTALQKALAGKKASSGFSLNVFSEAVDASCAVKDLETMLQLVYLTFTDIRKDEEVYAVNRDQIKNMLASYAAAPRFIFSDSLRNTMYGHNPLFSMEKAEDFDAANYDRILEIVKERTANAADYTFNFIGSFKPEELKPLVEKYIASLPATTERETANTKPVYANGKISNDFTIPMENPASTVYVIYHGIEKYTLRKDIMMSMLEQIMDIVYTETIREEEGGTYGVGTSASLAATNNEWMFLFGFDTNVEQQDHLTDRAKAELMNVVKNGVREKDFNKVKEYMLKEYDNNQRENSYWKTMLRNHALGINSYVGYKQALESITASELNNFIRTLFTGNENCTEVVMSGEVK